MTRYADISPDNRKRCGRFVGLSSYGASESVAQQESSQASWTCLDLAFKEVSKYPLAAKSNVGRTRTSGVRKCRPDAALIPLNAWPLSSGEHDMPYCTHCGTPNVQGARFCKNCGTAYTAVHAIPVTVEGHPLHCKCGSTTLLAHERGPSGWNSFFAFLITFALFWAWGAAMAATAGGVAVGLMLGLIIQWPVGRIGSHKIIFRCAMCDIRYTGKELQRINSRPAQA